MMSFVEWLKDPERGFYVRDNWDWDRNTFKKGGKLECPGWQERVLEHCFTPDEDGYFPYETVVLGWLKKSGKTAILAAMFSWFGEEGPEYSEIYATASDLLHAQNRAFDDFRYDRRERGERCYKGNFTFPNGSTIEALAKEYKSASGSRPALVGWDELWTYFSERDHRMWDEMTPPPTVKSPLRVVVTYAGFEDESDLLWELYEQNWVNGEVVPELADLVDDSGNPVCRRAGKTFVMWDTVPRMPWQTPEYYAEQARTLPAHQFVRYHKNQWVTTAEEFIPIAWYDRACVLDGQLRYRLDDKYRTYPIYLGVDVAPKYDCCVVVGMWHDAETGRVGQAFHKIWKPPRTGADIDLEDTVEAYILEMDKIFSLAGCVYDPAQFVRSAATLKKQGIVMIEVPQTSQNMIAASECLFDLLRENQLDLYYDEEAREHMRFAKAKITERGTRIFKDVKDTSRDTHKIDYAVALAMAVWHATNVGGVDTTHPIVIESPFGDVSHITYKTEAQKRADAILPEQLRD
jgi:hypothetical protein